MIVAALALAIGMSGAAHKVEATTQAHRAERRRATTSQRFCADVAMADRRGPKRICLTAAKWRKLGVDPVVPKG